MGNFLSSLNKSSIPHMPLNETTSIQLDVDNVNDNLEPIENNIQNKIKNIYDWVAENKTFCIAISAGITAVTMSACLMGYFYYLEKENKFNKENNKMTEELMCALNNFVNMLPKVYHNITTTEIWKDLTSKADEVLANYPQELGDKIKEMIERCNKLYQKNSTEINTTNSIGL